MLLRGDAYSEGADAEKLAYSDVRVFAPVDNGVARLRRLLTTRKIKPAITNSAAIPPTTPPISGVWSGAIVVVLTPDVFEVVLLVVGAVDAVVGASGRLSVSAVTAVAVPGATMVVVPLVVLLLVLGATIGVVVTVSFLLPQTTQSACGKAPLEQMRS
jgi:hypothetical protein